MCSQRETSTPPKKKPFHFLGKSYTDVILHKANTDSAREIHIGGIFLLAVIYPQAH